MLDIKRARRSAASIEDAMLMWVANNFCRDLTRHLFASINHVELIPLPVIGGVPDGFPQPTSRTSSIDKDSTYLDAGKERVSLDSLPLSIPDTLQTRELCSEFLVRRRVAGDLGNKFETIFFDEEGIPMG